MTKEELDLSLTAADFWIQIFAVLVAVGIVGEVGFGIRHWLLNKQLHRIEEFEELERQEKIAILTKEAEEARLATAKIQEKFIPRTLNGEQQARIVEKLKQFAGTEFKVSVSQDPEAIGLLAAMLGMLKTAGWIQRPATTSVVIQTSGEPAGISLSTGLYIHSPPSLTELAITVATVLHSEGLEARVAEASLPTSTMLHIEIGKKW